MKTINEFGEHLQQILHQMCKVINADPDNIDFKHEKWFASHEWTSAQENEFVEWMTDYLYENAAARREIMRWPKKNKKHCKSVAESFVFNYGWKTI